MSWFRNLRVGTKILSGYILLIILMAGIVGLSYWGTQQIGASEGLALQRQADIANLWTMQLYMITQYQHQADLIINDNTDAIAAFDAAAKKMDEMKQLAASAVDTTEEKQWLADLNQADAQFDSLFHDQVVPAQKAGDTEQVKKLDAQADVFLGQMTDNSQKLITSFGEEVVSATAAAGNTRSQITLWMLGLAALATVIGLALGYSLSRSISGPVQLAAQSATRLAAGDIEQEVVADSKDEIGALLTAVGKTIAYMREMAAAAGSLAAGDLTIDVAPQSEKDVLGNAFSQMIANLRQQVGQIREGADQVADASQQINTAAAQAG